MVDINESTLTSEQFAGKESNSVTENLLEDDLMDNLAYSDSDATSVTMNDEEFADAIDHILPSDAHEDGKYNRFIHLNEHNNKIIVFLYSFFFIIVLQF